MKYKFNHAHGLVLVEVTLVGPVGSMVATLALDTGATGTTVHLNCLVQIGYDPMLVGQPSRSRTVGGIVQAYRLPIRCVSALGLTRSNFTVASLSLPPNLSVQGLLGLDFFRGHLLTLDFQKGEIALTP